MPTSWKLCKPNLSFEPDAGCGPCWTWPWHNRFGLRHFYMTGPWNILILQASGDWSVLDQFWFFCRVKSCHLRFLIFECVIGWYLNCMLQNQRAIVMHSRSHTPWKLTAGSPEKYHPPRKKEKHLYIPTTSFFWGSKNTWQIEKNFQNPPFI